MKRCLIEHRVKSLKITAPYIIEIKFEDDTSQTINFRPITGRGMFKPLRDLEFFNEN